MGAFFSTISRAMAGNWYEWSHSLALILYASITRQAKQRYFREIRYEVSEKKGKVFEQSHKSQIQVESNSFCFRELDKSCTSKLHSELTLCNQVTTVTNNFISRLDQHVLPLSLQRCDTSCKWYYLPRSACPTQETMSAVTWTLLHGFVLIAEKRSVVSLSMFKFVLFSLPSPLCLQRNVASSATLSLSSPSSVCCPLDNKDDVPDNLELDKSSARVPDFDHRGVNEPSVRILFHKPRKFRKVANSGVIVTLPAQSISWFGPVSVKTFWYYIKFDFSTYRQCLVIL